MSRESERIFREWMQTKAWDLLRVCAGKRFKGRHAPREWESAEEFASDMWLMLMEREGALRGRVARYVHEEDWVGLQRYMMSMTRSFLAERKRDKYYQRVRQVLSKADATLGYRVEHSHAAYGSPSGDATVVPSYAAIETEGPVLYWPEVRVDDLRSAGTILELAMVFREQLEADGRYGAEILIPVQVLCDYIRSEWKIEYESEMVTAPATEGGEEQPWDEWVGAMGADNSPGLLPEEGLREMADRVALQLDDRQQLFVFCLSEYCGFKQGEIAAMLGLSGPSGVNYRLREAKKSLCFFVSLEEELERDRQELFRKMLLSNCKDEDCSRLEEEKAVKETRS